MESTDRILIGGVGGKYLKESLEKSTNPFETIRQFQDLAGLRNRTNSQPALSLLDLLGMKRCDVYRSLLESLSKMLHQRILSLNEEQLGNLLMTTFPYIEFPELRSIPIAILSQQKSTPEAFLKKLTENRLLLEEIPLHVKQRIWRIDSHEILICWKQFLDTYRREKELLTICPWDWALDVSLPSERRRKMERSLRHFLSNLGTDSVLYLQFLQMLRNGFFHSFSKNATKYLNKKTSPSHTSSLPSSTVSSSSSSSTTLSYTTHLLLPYIGTIRCDIINLQKDQMTNLARTDPLHKIAWRIDTILKQDLIERDQLVDLIGLIRTYRIGPLEEEESTSSSTKTSIPSPVSSKRKRKNLSKDEVPDKNTTEESVNNTKKQMTAKESQSKNKNISNKSKDDENHEEMEDKTSFEIQKAIPTQEILLKLWSQLSKIDRRLIFAEPVPEEVPGYKDVVSHPMDLSTIRQKIMKNKYETMDTFRQDFQLMIDNCLKFNDSNTIFYKEALKLQKQGKECIDQALTPTKRSKRTKRTTPKGLAVAAAIDELNAEKLQNPPSKSSIKAKPLHNSSSLRKITTSGKPSASSISISTTPTATSTSSTTSSQNSSSESSWKVNLLLDGAYEESFQDICLMVSDSYFHQLCMKSLFFYLIQCIETNQLPAEHPMVCGIIQLLQLGQLQSMSQQFHQRKYFLPKPSPALMRLFLPLLTRTLLINGPLPSKYASWQQKVTEHSEKVPLPLMDKSLWEHLLLADSIVPDITLYLLIQSLKRDLVNNYKPLIQWITSSRSPCVLFHDRRFLQSFFSALMVHKGSISMHMRVITIDEFFLPYLKHEGKHYHPNSDMNPDFNLDSSISSNLLLCPMVFTMHTQFSRWLSDCALHSDCNIPPPDLQAYAHDALSGLNNEYQWNDYLKLQEKQDSVTTAAKNEDLLYVWEHPSFSTARKHYEKFFTKFPGARTELGLPVPSTPSSSASPSSKHPPKGAHTPSYSPPL